MLIALPLLSALVAAGQEECKGHCATRGNQCRVACRGQTLRELCFTLCKNDEADCKGDCAMGMDPSKQRGVQAPTLARLELQCSSGNGRACLSAANGWFTGRDGVKDENKAATLLKAACGRREADACAAAGDLLLDGRAVPKNLASGLDYLEKACQWNSALGCFLLGRAFETGRAGKTDLGRARKLYVEACTAELGPACFALGTLLTLPGPQQDLEKAPTYVERACDLDDAAACDALCAETRKPSGAPRDGLLSLTYCAKACDGQVMTACTSQALMLLGGPPFKPNPKKAKELLDAACDGTDARACVLLGDGLERGSHGWKKSPADSARALERAALIIESPCRRGEPGACAIGALLAAEGKGGLSPGPETRARLEPLCGEQETSGCAALGKAWLAEPLGPVDGAKARAALELGCKSRTPLSCGRLAGLLAAGAAGVPADPASAATLAQGACDEGEGEACVVLAGLLSDASSPLKDLKKAKLVKKQACKLGVKAACR